MTSQRARDRWAGAALGALAVLGLLVAVVVVAVLALTDPAPSAAPPSPASPRPAEAPGTLAEGQTWLGDVALDAGSLLTPDADLRDVQAEGTDVLTGADGIRAGSLDVEATVPFEVVAAQIGPGTTITAAEDGQATVTRDVRALGRALEVQATGTVEVVRGRLVVEPRSVDVEGLSFLSSTLAAAARELVTIEQDVEGLPPGLVLREVTVTDDGFRARLDGEDVLVAP
ncbi:LmeA family phospholipid-binding protein [Aquipuribacter hungaricus]|uniref:LmeA family phospholipid-binding protein n=1 Tax=Aquipuribacter hungaricus TaxID=545624 RepID=A0ABV7WJB3_9MICO